MCRRCLSWARVAASQLVVAFLTGLVVSCGKVADSAVGTVFGFGSVFGDWKFLAAALAFPALVLVLIPVVRWRERDQTKRSPPPS